MSTYASRLGLILGIAIGSPAAFAGRNVVVIDGGGGSGQFICELLSDHGYKCTVFPKEGPTGPLDPFDVVVDLSSEWSDPTGMLADFMRAEKTVIVVYDVPLSLGINSNPTVQAWIGANMYDIGTSRLVSTVRDPLLGDIPPGTELADCAASGCAAVSGTEGHPNAIVLARYTGPAHKPIGIMRNFWEGGVSVYMLGFKEEIFLNAVRARQLTIPAVSTWGLLILGLGIAAAGTIVLRRRRSSARSVGTLAVLLGACLFDFNATARAEVISSQEGGVTYFRLGDAEPFHSTDKTVTSLRSVAIPNSVGLVVLWDETDPNSARQPFYAVSLDGKDVDTVRATSYDLQLGYVRFDPALESPAVRASLTADPDAELYIVQFVTQPLSAFRAAVKVQGATIYDFLPSHAYVVRLPTSARVAVEALPFVRAVVPYHPAYRLEAFLRENLDRAEELFPLQRYNIRVFEPAQKAFISTRIAAMGGVLDSADAGKRMMIATLTTAQLVQVARFNEVLFIDRWSPMMPTMNNVRSVSGANYIEQTPGNYLGRGVRGEVFDCAFNLDHWGFDPSPECPCDTENPNNTRCELIVHGEAVPKGNHGAATSAIIFGNGYLRPNARGLLPCGQGIVADYELIGLSGPDSARCAHTGELVDPSSGLQAVFQSTSAGTGGTLDYLSNSADMDDIFFDFDLVHCQAQGNYGTRSSEVEAWAKNTISVGGVRHFDDDDSFTSYSDDLWCHGPPDCSGCCSDCCIYSGYCASIGPALDDRVKPDLVGFFDCIETGTCCPPFLAFGPCGECTHCSRSEYTTNFFGTSAATPMVCGLAGLFFEMWADGSDADGKNIFGMPVPSCDPLLENCVFKRRPHASTVKAMLINTATQYDWVNGPLPNRDIDRFKQGWGVPNVKNIYDLRQKMVIIDESIVLTELGFALRTVQVNAGEAALKVTLAYADPAAAPNANPTLVNDLTLKVISPSGTVYWGNYGLMDGIWSVADINPATSEADQINNVENVFVPNPPQGLWTIRVSADNITKDGHCTSVEPCSNPSCTPSDGVDDVDFALVVSGAHPTGACCLPTTCSITSQDSCIPQGGTFIGVNTSCQPVGACCAGTTCTFVAQACCTSQGGSFKGNGVTCDDCNENTLPDACETGLRPCCVPWLTPPQACILWTQQCCSAVGGDYYPNKQDCSTVTCFSQ